MARLALSMGRFVGILAFIVLVATVASARPRGGSVPPRPKADIKNCGRHHGATFYRLRVGDFRVVYVVEERQVKVTEIFRHGRGYRWLE